ncbi:MAG: phenylalanine--tRNA ligase subunit alpha, partial [Oscillospiraceae bacterium]|nr:phenylalanine--tRNA ligase subunit alpha [Oscillospiraceae bacterium]
MKQQLEKIQQEALAALQSVTDQAELEALRVRFLGKKGELTAVLKMMGKLSAEERPVMGQVANAVRAVIEEKLDEAKVALKAKAMEERLAAEAIDVTIPGTSVELGHRHPMNIALDEAKELFISMGFEILDGPEVELADYNFTLLNIAENHPPRDRSDTFYITEDDKVLLRTQTSPMQIRAMERIKNPPIRILAPGRVYRKDEVDATHSPMFHQIEG